MQRYLMFETFQDIVVVFDKAANVYFGNQAASVLFEVSPRRLTSGRPLSQFVSFEPDLVGNLGDLTSVRQATQIREVEFLLPSGKRGTGQVTIQPQPEFFSAEGSEEAAPTGRWILSMRDVSLEKVLHVKYKGELDQREVMIKELREARAALEAYSLDLETKVAERTAELREASRLQKTILDSLGQGILVFDDQGQCLPIHSMSCHRLFKQAPSGKSIAALLELKAHERDEFAMWSDTVFKGLLDFEDLAPLCPVKTRAIGGLELSFDFFPLSRTDGELLGVVVVATDRTEELKAKRKASEESALVSRVTQVARNRDAFRLFVTEARRLLGEITSSAKIELEEVERRLHTLKGGAASFSLAAVADACHALESEIKVIGAMKLGMNRTLERGSAKILGMLETELSSLTELLGPSVANTNVEAVEVPLPRLVEWSRALAGSEMPAAAQQIAERIRQEAYERPVGAQIRHMTASLKSMAASLGKRLDVFEVLGGDSRIPPQFASELIASLVHAFRNSIYHGLETVEERKAHGKAEGGHVTAFFSRKDTAVGSWLRISIQDDGRGIDPEKIRAKLRAMSCEELAQRSDEEVVQEILRGRISTAESIDLVAGRGMGMSAIAEQVQKLGGKIEVYSKLGRGTRLEIHVPIPKELVNPIKSAA